jgi:hypothetical protein
VVLLPLLLRLLLLLAPVLPAYTALTREHLALLLLLLLPLTQPQVRHVSLLSTAAVSALTPIAAAPEPAAACQLPLLLLHQ